MKITPWHVFLALWLVFTITFFARYPAPAAAARAAVSLVVGLALAWTYDRIARKEGK